MTRSEDRVREMLAQSGIAEDGSEGVAQRLAALERLVPDTAPPPSPALLRAMSASSAAVVTLPGRRTRMLLAGVAALGAVAAGGIAASANELPSGAQRIAAEISERFLPFSFPHPEDSPADTGDPEPQHGGADGGGDPPMATLPESDRSGGEDAGLVLPDLPITSSEATEHPTEGSAQPSASPSPSGSPSPTPVTSPSPSPSTALPGPVEPTTETDPVAGEEPSATSSPAPVESSPSAAEPDGLSSEDDGTGTASPGAGASASPGGGASASPTETGTGPGTEVEQSSGVPGSPPASPVYARRGPDEAGSNRSERADERRSARRGRQVRSSDQG